VEFGFVVILIIEFGCVLGGFAWFYCFVCGCNRVVV